MNFGLVKRLRRETAVGSRHHILAANQLGKADQPFSDQFGMLNDIAGMGNDPGAQHLSRGHLHPFEQVVFMFMARIRSLEAERTGVDLKHVADDFWQIRFVDSWPLVDPVTSMEADPLGRNTAECRIGRFDVNLRLPLLLLIVKSWL